MILAPLNRISGMLKRILEAVALVVVLFGARPASACEKDERAVGPVCVVKAGLETGGITYIVNTAYIDGHPDAVVWEGVGWVDQADLKQLVAIEKVLVDGKGMRDLPVTYTWNAKRHRYVKSH